jgi:hypothetical protein
MKRHKLRKRIAAVALGAMLSGQLARAYYLGAGWPGRVGTGDQNSDQALDRADL